VAATREPSSRLGAFVVIESCQFVEAQDDVVMVCRQRLLSYPEGAFEERFGLAQPTLRQIERG